MLRQVALVCSRRHSRVCGRRWLVTSRQKRALNKEQLEGKADTGKPSPPTPSSAATPPPATPPPAAPPPATPPPSASTPKQPIAPAGGTPAGPSSGGGDYTIPLGIAGLVGAGGVAYYLYSGEQPKEEEQPAPEPEATAEASTGSEPQEEKPPEPEPVQEEATEEPEPVPEPEPEPEPVPEPEVEVVPVPNRVVSIQVPSKMKNTARVDTDAAIPDHPEQGNRVTMNVKKSPPIDDGSVTEKAIAELQESQTQQATEALVQSHQSLWNSMDASFFQDLDSLNSAQLKARVVQLATEMKDRTKWEAVRLKEFLAMKEQETTDQYMQILQKQRLEFEDLLSARLREQESTLLKQMQKALDEKDANVQSVIDSALQAQQNEHEEDKRAFQETTSSEMQAELQREFSNKMEEYKTQVAGDLKQKVATLNSLTDKLKTLEAALAASQTSKQGSLKAHRLSAAALALAEKLETSEGAAKELKALKSAADQGGVIATALSTIPKDAAASGVPTLSELQSRFDYVHRKCRQAAMVPSGRPGLEGQLAGMVFSTLKYPPGPDDPAPEDDRDSAEFVLVRAKKHVQLGELHLAVEQLEKLDGQAAFTVKDWKKAALDRVAVEKALKVIKLECALLNESLTA